eukprot:30533-Pelagococcus_subviridis.AAC.4
MNERTNATTKRKQRENCTRRTPRARRARGRAGDDDDSRAPRTHLVLARDANRGPAVLRVLARDCPRVAPAQ